jgi:hypothetical protein
MKASDKAGSQEYIIHVMHESALIPAAAITLTCCICRAHCIITIYTYVHPAHHPSRTHIMITHPLQSGS